MTDAALEQFWAAARRAQPELPPARPAAWPLGAYTDSAQADDLLTLVLAGVKTATSSSLWDYEAASEALPAVGDLGILLDGAGEPRAVVRTVAVNVTTFNEVDEDHAYAEGEGDRSLASWRREHERFWRQHSQNDRGFAPDMPVVCERLAVIYTGGSPS